MRSAIAIGPGRGGREVGRGHADVPDVAAGEAELAGEEVEVQLALARDPVREVAHPEPEAVLLLGQREVHDRVQPPGERLVHVGAQVGGQDGDAVEALHPLEQVGHLDVGVPVARVLDLGALAEQGVGLVEQQHAVDPVGLGEDAVQVLLGLADVLVDDGREVDHVQVQPEVAGEDLGRHRLAGAGIAGEQGRHPTTAGGGVPHPPLADDPVAVPCPRRDLAQLGVHRPGQDQVVPARDGLHPAGEALETGGVLGAGAGGDIGRLEVTGGGDGRAMGRAGGPDDLLRAEPEGPRRGRRVEGQRRRPVERTDPQLVALRLVGNRRVQHQRHLAAPGRVPAPGPHQDDRRPGLTERADRRRSPFDDRLHRTRDQAGTRAAGPRGLAASASGRGSSVARSRERSTSTAGRPSAAKAARARARPDAPPAWRT